MSYDPRYYALSVYVTQKSLPLLRETSKILVCIYKFPLITNVYYLLVDISPEEVLNALVVGIFNSSFRKGLDYDKGDKA